MSVNKGSRKVTIAVLCSLLLTGVVIVALFQAPAQDIAGIFQAYSLSLGLGVGGGYMGANALTHYSHSKNGDVSVNYSTTQGGQQ